MVCLLCVGGPDITLDEHRLRQASESRVDFTTGGNAIAECEANPLIRVHGRWRRDHTDTHQYMWQYVVHCCRFIHCPAISLPSPCRNSNVHRLGVSGTNGLFLRCLHEACDAQWKVVPGIHCMCVGTYESVCFVAYLHTYVAGSTCQIQRIYIYACVYVCAREHAGVFTMYLHICTLCTTMLLSCTDCVHTMMQADSLVAHLHLSTLPHPPHLCPVQVHRALMLIAIAPSVLGFILIFVAFRNNSIPGLITLGVSHVHVVMVCTSSTLYPLTMATCDSTVG